MQKSSDPPLSHAAHSHNGRSQSSARPQALNGSLAPRSASSPPARASDHQDTALKVELAGRALQNDPRVSPDLLVAMYKAMVRTRIVDERMVALQRQGRIGF